MRILVASLMLLLHCIAAANNEAAWQDEIDRQVWAPFVRAYESADGPAFNALYGDEVIRVTPEGIDTKSVFKQGNLQRFTDRRRMGIKIKLDFWFEHRDTNADTSYEVGYFRIRQQLKDESSTFYGQFHIVVKKIDGIWKITQDWDHSLVRGAEVSPEDFEHGTLFVPPTID